MPMPKFNQNREIPYKAKFIRKIILDVESYPEFLPWCSDAKILERKKNYFIANLAINFNGIKIDYDSEIDFYASKKQEIINVKAISGPFRKLNNVWTINSIKDNCNIDFFIDFELNSIMLNGLLEMVFSIATKKMITSFEQRAKQIQGRN